MHALRCPCCTSTHPCAPPPSTPRRVDCVIHFAGRKYVNESVDDPLRYYDHNVLGTVNLLKTMAAHGCKHIVFSSSCTVYGNPQVRRRPTEGRWRGGAGLSPARRGAGALPSVQQALQSCKTRPTPCTAPESVPAHPPTHHPLALPLPCRSMCRLTRRTRSRR